MIKRILRKILTWYYEPDTTVCYWHRLNQRKLYLDKEGGLCCGIDNHVIPCKYCLHYKGGD